VFDKLFKSEFFSQFNSKDISAEFALGNGIDAVSSATNSSYGVTKAVANAAGALKIVIPANK